MERRILATYQPTNPDPTYKSKSVKLDDFLGYCPIWCFSANNLKEFIINSILAAPNMPEELYVFETDDYKAIDVVKWNTYLYNEKTSTPIELSECFDITDDKYSEYIIKQIPSEDKLLLKINLHDALYHTNYSCDNDDEIGELLSRLTNTRATQAGEWATNVYKNSKVTTDGDMSEAKSWGRKRFEKMAFELFLSPFILGTTLPNSSFVDITSFHPELYFQKAATTSKLMAANYNSDMLPTYERQDNILSLLSSCFVPFAPWGNKKIERNAPCPCGSGKKYKKCCLGKYYTN